MTLASGAESGQLVPGTKLGRYQIVSHLATGGMAEIYLARASGIANFERLVVVKRILPHWAANPDFIEMFLDEARLAATLQHANIAQVFDIGEHKGSYFFTMEFVHGEDARTIFKTTRNAGTRIPIEHVLEIIRQAASGLHYAHMQKDADGKLLGIVHRDVSPSNILVSFDGSVKIVDFGVAKAAGRSHETSTGTLKGKISYMSPEQIAADKLDQRSDVFALGILLYELSTGTRLFEGETDLQVLKKIAEDVIVPPSSVCPDLPPMFDAIILKALARDRDERFASALELQTELEQFAHEAKLMTSQRTLSTYMHELFADRITAWDAAQKEGKSLASHLVESSLFELTPSGTQRLTPSGLLSAQSTLGLLNTAATMRPAGLKARAGSVPEPIVGDPTGPADNVTGETRAIQPGRVGTTMPGARLLTIPPAAKPVGRRLLGWLMMLVMTAGATVAVILFVLPKFGYGAVKATPSAPAPVVAPAVDVSPEVTKLDEARRLATEQQEQLEATRKQAAVEREELERLREEAQAQKEALLWANEQTETQGGEGEVDQKEFIEPVAKKKRLKKSKKKKVAAVVVKPPPEVEPDPPEITKPKPKPKKKKKKKSNSNSLFLPSKRK